MINESTEYRPTDVFMTVHTTVLICTDVGVPMYRMCVFWWTLCRWQQFQAR